MKQIFCSDWMRGWGYGGHDRIGKLYKNEDGSFTWRGRTEGRHGHTFQSKIITTFTVSNENEIVISETSKDQTLPDYRDIREAIRILNIPIKVKEPRTKRNYQPDTQLPFTF
jgi:hypothetical protein